jgi:hypothetical protein
MRHVSISWGEALSQWWRSALCKVLGHAKPQQRMFCRICSRCRQVIGGGQ